MKKITLILPVLALVFAACSPAIEEETTSSDEATQETQINNAGSEQEAMDSGTSNTIVDVAVGAGTFETLVAALQTTGLDEALVGEGPFTVFAPTDEAFAKLPAGTVEGLLENPDELAEILKYHVVSGEVKAADVVTLSEATTLQGGTIAINASEGGVTLNDTTTVVQTDIMADNGVIHVIDSVLLP